MSVGRRHPVSSPHAELTDDPKHGPQAHRGPLLGSPRGSARRHDDFSGHSHGDSQYRHVPRVGAKNPLAIALVLIASFALVEFLGGLWSGSLALLADSGHMLTDAAALGFSLAAHIIAQRPVSARHSYGLARTEVIAAFVNSLALVGVVIWLLIEGIDRIAHPVAVNGKAVFVIASGGLLVNLVVAWVLSRDRENLNIRAALLHVLGDLLGSVAALLAGLIIMFTGYTVVDPLLSMLVSGLILHSVFSVLRESTSVLLDSVPPGVDYQSVGKALATIPGVISVHDLHVWAMVPGHGAVSAHVLIDRIERWPAILHLARQRLKHDYQIDHVTLQPEWLGHSSTSASIPIQPKL